MKGLLKKEKLMMVQQFWGYFMVVGIWIFVCVWGVIRENTPPPYIVVSYCYLFTGVIKLSFSLQDNLSKWDKTVFTMPYKRSDIVSVNYITTLQLMLILVAMHFAGSVFLGAVNTKYDIFTIARLIPPCLAIGLLPEAIFCPLMITQMNKPGNKPVLSVSTALLTVVMMLLVNKVISDKDGNVMLGVSFIILGISVVMFVASWLLSLRMIKNKDIF